jgi:hypothetical protein
MSILSDLKDIYSSLPKQQPPTQPITPIDPDLMSSVIDTLNKQPIVAPNINRKES